MVWRRDWADWFFVFCGTSGGAVVEGGGLRQFRHGGTAERQQTYPPGRWFVAGLAALGRKAQRRRWFQLGAAGRSLFADRCDAVLSQASSSREFFHRQPRRLSSADGHSRETQLRRAGENRADGPWRSCGPREES